LFCYKDYDFIIIEEDFAETFVFRNYILNFIVSYLNYYFKSNFKFEISHDSNIICVAHEPFYFNFKYVKFIEALFELHYLCQDTIENITNCGECKNKWPNKNYCYLLIMLDRKCTVNLIMSFSESYIWRITIFSLKTSIFLLF